MSDNVISLRRKLEEKTEKGERLVNDLNRLITNTRNKAIERQYKSTDRYVIAVARYKEEVSQWL